MKRKLALICTVVLSSGLLFGCTGEQKKAEEPKPTTQTEQKADQQKSSNEEKKDVASEQVSLDNWKGTWNSIVGWYDDAEVIKALGDGAKEAMEKKAEGSHTDFKSLVVDGNTITFLDAIKDGKEIAKSEYKFVEKKIKGEGEHGEWDVFEATGDVDSKFKVIALMPIHGEEGDLTHFHARYGATADEALSDDSWWPVIAAPDTTVEQVVGEIKTID